jgi:hypothetical protein
VKKVGTSRIFKSRVYCETGWEKLIVRGEVKKLNLFYKIINNEAPEYLSELIPPTVAESNNYNFSYSSQFIVKRPVS